MPDDSAAPSPAPQTGQVADAVARAIAGEVPWEQSIGTYMSRKRRKQHEQYLAEPIAVGLQELGLPAPPADRDDSALFCGCVFWVNGYTNPPLSVLRPLITARGGLVDLSLMANTLGSSDRKNTITHIIATSMPTTKLAELRTALPMRARGAVVPAFVSRAVAGVQTNLLGGAASDIQRPSAPTNHPTASHVGADGDASSPVPRALRHVPIVLPEWVLASLSLGHLAPIEPFLVTPQVPKHAIPAPVGAAHALPAPAFPMRQRVEGVGLESDQGRDRVIHATTAGAAELSAREGAQTAATLPLLAHSAQGLDRQSLAEADKGEPKQKVWKPLQVQPERAENTAVAEQTEATDAQPLPVAAEPAAVSAEAGPGTGGTFRARAPAAAAYHSTSRLHLLGSWRSECYLPQTLPAILAARADAPPLLPAPPLPGQQTLPTEKAAGQAKQQGGVVLPPPLPLQTWALWRDLPALAPSPALSGKQRWRLSEAAATALGDPAVPYLVIHVDMDSFFVSAALAHRPELLDTTLLAHTGTARPRVCTMGEADHSTEAGDGDVVRVRVCGRPAAVSHGAHGVPASVTAASAAAASASSSESAVLTSFAPPAGWALASVASCTHPARSHGVHADMRLGTALRLCPSLAVVPYDFPAVRAAAAALHGELARVGDWVVPLSVDEGLVVASRKDAVEAFLDRADVEHFLDLAAPPCSDVSSTSLPLVSLSHIDAAASLWLCSLLHARVLAASRCPCSVGAGPSLFLAKTATGQAKPGGVRVVIPVGTDASFGENAQSVGRVVWAGALEFLRPLPLSELPGLGRVGRKKINTILAAAAAAPAAAAAGAGDAKSAPDGTRSQDDSSDDDEEQEQKDGSWTCGALQDFIFQHNPALVAGSRPRSSFPQITTLPTLTAAFGPAASLSLCHFALGFDSRKVETTFRLHDLAAVAGAAAAAAAGSSSSDTDAVAAAVAAAAAAAAGPPRSVSVDVTWGVRLSTPAHAHALLLQVAAQALTRLRGARAAAGRATLRLMVRAEGVVTDPKFMGHGRCEVFSKSVAFTTPLNPLSDPVSASTGGTDSAGADSFDPLTAAASSALASTDADGAPDDAALRVHKVKPRSLRLIFSALLGLLQGPLKKPVQDIRGVSVILSNLTPASGATGAGAGQGVAAGGAGAGAAGTLEGFVKMQGAISLSSLKKKGDADSDDDDDILEVVSVTRQPASSAVAVDGTGGAKKRGRKRAAPAPAPVSAFSAGTAQSKGHASPPRAPADAPNDPAPTVPAAAAPESDLMRQWVASAAAASAAAAAAAAELAAAKAAAAEAEAVVRGPEMSAGEFLTLLQHQSRCPAAAGRCKLLSQAAQTQGKVCGRGCGARECSPCLAHAAASAAAAAAVGSAQIADAGDVLGRGVAARVHGLLGDHARLRGLSVREKTLLRTLLLLLRPSSTAIAGTTAAVVAAVTPSTMCPSSPLKPHTTDIPAEATVPSDVSSAPVSEPHQAASDETPEVLTPHPDAASAFVAELDAASQAIAPLGCDLDVVQARVSAFVSSLLRADFVFTPPNEGAFIAIPLVCMQSVAPASDPAPARASVFAWATISPSRWRNGLLWLASGAVHLCKSHRPSAAAAVARAVADAAGNGLVRKGVLMVQGDVHAVAKWYPSASEGAQLSVAEMTDPPCSRYSTPADARRRFTNQVTNLLALANEILGQDVRDFQEQVGEAVRAVIEDE